jgi:hypothetical protein
METFTRPMRFPAIAQSGGLGETTMETQIQSLIGVILTLECCLAINYVLAFNRQIGLIV